MSAIAWNFSFSSLHNLYWFKLLKSNNFFAEGESSIKKLKIEKIEKIEIILMALFDLNKTGKIV